MQKRELEVGDILQLRPDHKFGGMLVVVTDPKSFGCQGYLMHACNIGCVPRYKGFAYIRVIFADMEYIGKMEFLYEHLDSSDENDVKLVHAESIPELNHEEK